MRLRMRYEFLYKGLIFPLLLLINCKDQIDLRGEGNMGVLVIDGKVTTLPGPYTLKLGYTVGLDQKPSPVTFANALLVDEDTGASETFVESRPGLYLAQGAVVPGVAGHRYHVEVSLLNGKRYATKTEKIPDATATDDLSYEFGSRSEFIGEVEVKENILNVYTDTELPQGENDYYLRWDVGETYVFEETPIMSPFTGRIPNPCYIDGVADPQRIVLFSTENNEVKSLKQTLIAQRKIDYSFLSRHYFSVSVLSITRESYRYWNKINELINRSGSIFDTPPAPITGNAYSITDPGEAVFGFFEAANASLNRFYTLRGNIPVSIAPYCNDPVRGLYWQGYPKECSSCTSLDNSKVTPPDWWEF